MELKPVFLVDERSRCDTLLEVYARHPEVAQVLVNINFDRDLTRNVVCPGCSEKMLLIYVNTLFLPVLLEHEIVRRNPARKCGYEAFFSDIQVKPTLFTLKERAAIAMRCTQAIVESIDEGDSVENTLIAPITFSVTRQQAQELMASQKRFLQEQLQTPDTHTEDSVIYRVSVTGKIYV
jgi:hypothetical protein